MAKVPSVWSVEALLSKVISCSPKPPAVRRKLVTNTRSGSLETGRVPALAAESRLRGGEAEARKRDLAAGSKLAR